MVTVMPWMPLTGDKANELAMIATESSAWPLKSVYLYISINTEIYHCWLNITSFIFPGHHHYTTELNTLLPGRGGEKNLPGKNKKPAQEPD